MMLLSFSTLLLMVLNSVCDALALMPLYSSVGACCFSKRKLIPRANPASEAGFFGVGLQFGAFGVGIDLFFHEVVAQNVEIQGVALVQFNIRAQRTPQAVDITAVETRQEPAGLAFLGVVIQSDVNRTVVSGFYDWRVQVVAHLEIGVRLHLAEALVLGFQAAFQCQGVLGILVHVVVTRAACHLKAFLQREVPVAIMHGSRDIGHESVARILERFRIGAIAVDEGIAQAEFDVWMHLVTQS